MLGVDVVLQVRRFFDECSSHNFCHQSTRSRDSKPSAQIGLVLGIDDSNNIPSSSSSSTIVTTTPREGREASVESKRAGLGHFPADWPPPFCSIDRSGKSSQMKWPSQYQSFWGRDPRWISFTMDGRILRKSPRRPHFVESAIEKRRGFPKFHNLKLPPVLENRFIQQNWICEVSNRPPPAVLAATTRTGVFLHHQPPPDPSTCTNSLRLKKKRKHALKYQKKIWKGKKFWTDRKETEVFFNNTVARPFKLHR